MSRAGILLLTVSACVLLSAAVMVLMIPFIPAVPLGAVLGLSFDTRLALLLLVFAASGAGASGQYTGHMSYICEFTPERTRAVYLATYYFVLLPLAFMPMLSAALIGTAGRYVLNFAVGALMAAATLIVDLRLRPLRERPAQPHLAHRPAAK